MMKIGEYVRSTRGEIIKIENEIMQGNYMCYFKNSYCNIKAHSKNIIDLIEVGDIVEIQNKLDGSKTIFNLNKDIISIYKEQLENGSIKLTSILTHEIYEREAYKIE